MQLILAIILFILILGTLVFIHELGHFLTAKKVGVVVQEFAFGFGPKLWSKKWKGTLYRINLIPLGGYVKMLGDQDGSSFMRYVSKPYDEADKTYALELMKKVGIDPKKDDYDKIEGFMQDQEKKISEDDYKKLQNYFMFDYVPHHPGNYDNKPIRARVAIVVMGVVMNFILAAIIFQVMFMAYRTVDLVKLGNPTFVAADAHNPPVIFTLYGQNDELEGSVVQSVNGKNIATEEEFNEILKANYDKPVEVSVFSEKGFTKASVVLDGEGIKSNFDADIAEKVILLGVFDNTAAKNAGFKSGDVIISFNDEEITDYQRLSELIKENKGKTVKIVYIDENGEKLEASLPLPSEPDPETQTIFGASFSRNNGFYAGALRINYDNNMAVSGIAHTVNIIIYNITGFAELISQSIAQGTPAPAAQGVSSVIGIADVVYSLVKIEDYKNILNLSAMISATLAFMNILPIPLFDGGNLFFLILEKLRGRPLSEKSQERIGMVSFYLIIILFALVLLKDVFQYIFRVI